MALELMNYSFSYPESINDYKIRMASVKGEAVCAANDFDTDKDITVVERGTLNFEQDMAHDIFIDNCTNSNYKSDSIAMLGMGGCGKSHVIHAIRTPLHGSEYRIASTSTTGLTANQINSFILHSALKLGISAVFSV